MWIILFIISIYSKFKVYIIFWTVIIYWKVYKLSLLAWSFYLKREKKPMLLKPAAHKILRIYNFIFLVLTVMMLWKISKKLNNWLYILDYHEQLLKNLQNTNQTEPITGLLLVYMKHLVHVMEVSMSHDYSFLFFPVCLNFYLPFPPIPLSPPPSKRKK